MAVERTVPDRWRAIAHGRRDGLSYGELAGRFEISRERVRQILAAYEKRGGWAAEQIAPGVARCPLPTTRSDVMAVHFELGLHRGR